MKRGRAALFCGFLIAACSSESGTDAPRVSDVPVPVPAPDSPPAAAATPAPTGTATTPPATKTSPPTAASCFAAFAGKVKGPDYDQFAPVIDASCAGTHHQTITGVERVVFLGDSVTAGTPPTPIKQFYASQLADLLKAKFGPSLEVASCAQWGAAMHDFQSGKNELASCFPGDVQNKRTLVVMTMGGNDIAYWAKNKMDAATATTKADEAAAYLRAAVTWLKDPVRFPKGSFVVMSNVYEYTDTSGDLASCPAATLSGFSGSWPEGAPAIVHFQEQIMKVAVDTKTDMMFLLEHFCGHGYKRDDPSLQCYRGPNAELWFDLTCYHPNPTGHTQIAKLFEQVIDG